MTSNFINNFSSTYALWPQAIEARRVRDLEEAGEEDISRDLITAPDNLCQSRTMGIAFDPTNMYLTNYGDRIITDNLIACGDLSANGAIYVNGDLIVTGVSHIIGTTTLEGDVTITGDVVMGGVIATGHISIGSGITETGNVNFTGIFNVSGSEHIIGTTVVSRLILGSAFTVMGSSLFSATTILGSGVAANVWIAPYMEVHQLVTMATGSTAAMDAPLGGINFMDPPLTTGSRFFYNLTAATGSLWVGTHFTKAAQTVYDSYSPFPKAATDGYVLRVDPLNTMYGISWGLPLASNRSVFRILSAGGLGVPIYQYLATQWQVRGGWASRDNNSDIGDLTLVDSATIAVQSGIWHVRGTLNNVPNNGGNNVLRLFDLVSATTISWKSGNRAYSSSEHSENGTDSTYNSVIHGIMSITANVQLQIHQTANQTFFNVPNAGSTPASSTENGELLLERLGYL